MSLQHQMVRKKHRGDAASAREVELVYQTRSIPNSLISTFLQNYTKNDGAMCQMRQRRHQPLYQSIAIYNPRTQRSRHWSTGFTEISRKCSPQVSVALSRAPAAAPAVAGLATAPRRSPSPTGPHPRPRRDVRRDERPRRRSPGSTGPAGCPEGAVAAAVWAERPRGGWRRGRGSGRGPGGRGGGRRTRAAGAWRLRPVAPGWPEAADGGRGGWRGAPWTDAAGSASGWGAEVVVVVAGGQWHSS